MLSRSIYVIKLRGQEKSECFVTNWELTTYKIVRFPYIDLYHIPKDSVILISLKWGVRDL